MKSRNIFRKSVRKLRKSLQKDEQGQRDHKVVGQGIGAVFAGQAPLNILSAA
jgi:hypothetical protein